MYRKEYYEKNKDMFKEHHKRYYEKHKEQIKQYHKDYYEKNKEYIYQQQQEWRNKNKDKCLKSALDSRHRRIERLKAEGVTNPWGVVMRGSKPKYRKDEGNENSNKD